MFDDNPLRKQNSQIWDAAFCGVLSGDLLFAYVPIKRMPGLNELNTSRNACLLFYPYLTNGFPVIINSVSPLSFLGVLGVIFVFYLIFDEISLCKQNSPRWDAAFCGVTSGAILFAYVPQKECQAYMS